MTICGKILGQGKEHCEESQ